jgi:Ca2+-binding EF-hand superfamily protein
LKEFFGKIGGKFSEEEFTKLFDELDVSQNGKINKNEMR